MFLKRFNVFFPFKKKDVKKRSPFLIPLFLIPWCKTYKFIKLIKYRMLCLSLRPSVCLSVCLFVCLSI